nr:MAG TPA: hypothetical protein [Caudoviricetes sp.]
MVTNNDIINIVKEGQASLTNQIWRFKNVR